jgi:Ricin-type beta-trefoil lectin domain
MRGLGHRPGGAGRSGRRLARWQRAGAAAIAVPLAASAVIAAPALAQGAGYHVIATIPVGSGPFGVAADPATGIAYVANSDSGTVSEISSPLVPGPIVSGYRTGTCIQPDGTIRSAGGLCLDVYRDEKTNKAPVNLYACTGGANQEWFATAGTLVNPESGKCLDDPRFSTAPGTRLEIYTCNGGANQQWILPVAPS